MHNPPIRSCLHRCCNISLIQTPQGLSPQDPGTEPTTFSSFFCGVMALSSTAPSSQRGRCVKVGGLGAHLAPPLRLLHRMRSSGSHWVGGGVVCYQCPLPSLQYNKQERGCRLVTLSRSGGSVETLIVGQQLMGQIMKRFVSAPTGCVCVYWGGLRL